MAAFEIASLRCEHVGRKRRFGRRIETNHRATLKVAAVAGMVGPVLFATTLLSLTVVQYHFMLGIGWQPLADPAGAWPSGLALGPHGWVQTLNFVLSGLLLMLFAAGLHLGTKNGRGSWIGPPFLSVAGTAMALVGFETDPIRRTAPRTPHGLIHDLAFVLFILALLPAFFFLWRRFREDVSWRNHARYTLATGMIATLLLLLPGVAYYLFIAVSLVWISITGVKLWRSTSLGRRASSRPSPVADSEIKEGAPAQHRSS